MDDYIVVINAGSSSLKFCIYRRPESSEWGLEARGQIEGIGTSPRFSAKDGAGGRLADTSLDATVVRDGRSALDALGDWLRSTYSGARILGVGHRVVHGGPRFAAPTIVTPQVLDELRALIPLAPLHQPHNLAAIDAVSERLPGVPQVVCFDTGFHRGQPAVAEIVPLPREICAAGVQRYGFHGLSYRVHRVGAAARSAGDCRRARHRRSPRKRRQSVRDEEPQERRQHAGVHGTRRSVHGHTARIARSRRRSVSLSEPRAHARKKSRRSCTRSRDCSAFPASVTTCATCSAGTNRWPVWRSIISSTRPPRRSERSPPSWAGSTGSSSLRASARTRPRSAGGSAGVGLARRRAGRGCEQARSTRISRPGSRVSAWVIPTNEELVIARHTGALLKLGVGSRSALV